MILRSLSRFESDSRLRPEHSKGLDLGGLPAHRVEKAGVMAVRFFSRFSVATNVGAGFGLLICLLISVATVSYQG
ncbi:hypothetical protein [Methylosinus sp. Ce-a6]|uniref:hypothetical protein n=1 Tax=Methylosinus sp. Ce-a6 TaxID=2172005 RepID=UPI0013582B4F|nr:hypothetical protein [Methylosinus sp. Ce-a6]